MRKCQKDFLLGELPFFKNNRSYLYAKWCWRVLIKWPKMAKKCWSQPGFELGAFQEAKKVRNFCLKLYHWATEAFHKLWAKYCVSKQQPLPNWYGTLPILHLKCIKDTFSNKQIIEIKKKLHIHSFFTYSHSEIALKACRNIQRFKFICRPLWQALKSWQCFTLGYSSMSLFRFSCPQLHYFLSVLFSLINA